MANEKLRREPKDLFGDSVDCETIDPNNIQNDAERRWLQDWGFLPEGERKAHVFFYLPNGEKVSNDPNFLRAEGIGGVDIERLVEERASQMVAEQTQREANFSATSQILANREEHGNALNVPAPTGVPHRPGEVSKGQEGAEAEAEDEPNYETMSNDDLRAELSSRGLSVDGKKVDLIERLLEDDESKSPEDDQSEEPQA